MRVVEGFIPFNSNCMMWKSISSSGWEYLIVWKYLSSSHMYANYVLFNLLLFLNICWSCWGIVKHWFDIGMVVGSSLGGPELNFIFVKITFGLNVKSWRKP